ncbi:DNA-directed RNA polymerase subunit alpha [Faecalibaculum rodentium]|jgi:DNA-directed RNA polymerase subunit alpha|uniref:DNA-directed RNA polymerase subunit alpha n=1 Tax=Faecalibaculum rodentium TaxID=1702221 RepID=A0A140DX78_9FIRM|nr:DNA-directed RNA polymerase subunit alpha [Faecalibaculum rodentium]AMK55255.1 DNA-directed RNA polymerase, alpha subunit [Faecalibaculum rodentium]
MQEFERATFHKESQEDRLDKAVFLFEPLERGFGTTIGNAICRTMRSNLPGTGIVGFQIEGMEPGDTTISGLLEDTTALILNLKALMLTGDVDEAVQLQVHKKGPAIITAADIICPEEVEVSDPDQIICTLEKGADLNMDLYAARGTGYKSESDNRKNWHLPEDVQAIDTMFTPIRQAEYLSEPARLGQDIKYDKVHINVTTDGAITPLHAVSEAAGILMSALDQIVPLADLKLEECFTVQLPQAEENAKPATQMIEDLDLSVRSYNCLKRAGIQTVEELTQKTEDEMMHVKNLGKKSLKEVKDKMTQLGLSFKSYD